MHWLVPTYVGSFLFFLVFFFLGMVGMYVTLGRVSSRRLLQGPGSSLDDAVIMFPTTDIHTCRSSECRSVVKDPNFLTSLIKM